MTILDTCIIVGFLAAMALIGLTLSRLIRSADDFFVAGRQLTPFVLCATITATNISMLHLIGMGGTAYQSGVSIAWQNWAGDMALVLSGIFVVPILRRLRIRSVPEFLELRYNPKLRTLVAAFWGLKLCVFLGILLYVAATAAIVITGCTPTDRHYNMWLCAFSLVSVAYSTIGGAWAVAVMDSLQFAVMLGSALIVLPIATRAAGGMPAVVHFLKQSNQANHLAFVPAAGEFNWLFIIAITLLSLKWATVEQTILQRAFASKTPRMAAQGMVLSAIITTPIAFLWILPGLSAARLHPGFGNPDQAIPWLLANTVPPAGRGVLGIILCGLIAAQVSNITSDVNSVATLFASDVYRKLLRRPPSQRQLLIAVRCSALLCGAVMLLVAYALNHTRAGAVRANLTVVGIVDMPLFVVTIIYGLLWKRANWQGATAGFLAGGVAGIFTYALVTPQYFDGYLHPAASAMCAHLAAWLTGWHNAMQADASAIRNIVPLVSSATALVVTPLVCLVTAADHHGNTRLWDSFAEARNEEASVATFSFTPASTRGWIGAGLAVAGFCTFLFAVISAKFTSAFAAPLAIVAMLVVFLGGLIRVYSP